MYQADAPLRVLRMHALACTFTSFDVNVQELAGILHAPLAAVLTLTVEPRVG